MPALADAIEIEVPNYPIEVRALDGTNHGSSIRVLRYFRRGDRTWALLFRRRRTSYKLKTGPRWFKVHNWYDCWSLAEVTEYTGIGQRMGFMTIVRFIFDSRKPMNETECLSSIV